jgi:hypothetical protein
LLDRAGAVATYSSQTAVRFGSNVFEMLLITPLPYTLQSMHQRPPLSHIATCMHTYTEGRERERERKRERERDTMGTPPRVGHGRYGPPGGGPPCQ